MRFKKSLAILGVAAACAVPATSFGFTFTLSNPTVFTMAPANGSINVYIDGSVSIDPGDSSMIGYANPVTISGDSLEATLDPAYKVGIGGSYTGHILDFTISSTTPVGAYAFSGGLMSPANINVSEVDAVKGGNPDNISQNFVIVVAPCSTPEPAPFAALGLGGLVFIRRARRR